MNQAVECLESLKSVPTNAWNFAALMTENQHCIKHLDQAGYYLEHQVDDPGKCRNVLSQEEIIEEILLGTGLVCSPGERVVAKVV